MSDMTVAKTILQQLGGNRFIAMTGAKNLAGGTNYLSMQVGRNEKKVRYVRIDLTTSDLYKISAYNQKAVLVAETDDIYNDNLQEVFTDMTGMDTHL